MFPLPDLDGAHGFLTALLPLHTEPCARADGTLTSPAHAVRELLAGWPTARHSPACAASSLQSPFAGSPSTHLARFAVIDQPAFNGRVGQDAIVTAANVGPPLSSEPPVDVLGRPYLLFCADFDRGPDGHGAFEPYLAELWACMPGAWTALLGHCEGWRDDGGRQDFIAYLRECQIETTMPFNDYAIAPSTQGMPPIVAPLALSAVALVVVLVLVRLLDGGLPTILAWIVAAVAGVAAAGATALVAISRAARRSLPWTEGLDLKTVLKALDLQARFTRFVLDHQGLPAAELQAAFREFLKTAQPGNLDSPTQPPGVVPAPGGGA